jgi:hypothetical protein
MVLETWDSLTDPQPASKETTNQGGPPPAAPAEVTPPATPSVEVDAAKPATTPEAKSATPDPAAPPVDATKADAGKAPDPVAPPAVKTTDKPDAAPATKVDTAPATKADAAPAAKAEGEKATEGTEDETEADKAEFAGLPANAQAPARRYRKDSRQFSALKRDIGGEDFVEDAKLLVPAFHQKPAAEFDQVLATRSPQKQQELYTHHVYTAIDTPADRTILIKELAAKHRAELIAELGVEDKPGEREPKSQPQPGTTATAIAATDAANTAASLTTIEELLKDPYNTTEQKAALELAKNALTAQSQTSTQLAQMRTDLEALQTKLNSKEQTVEVSAAEKEENALGSEFVGKVRAHAEERLTALGLSVAEGDPPELKNFIEAERKKILDALPGKFQSDETGGGLASLLTEKFRKIPTLRGDAKKAETDNAWRFLTAAKACAEDILGKEIANPLFAIEAARRTQQAPSTTTDQRKEIVGHESPSSVPQPETIVKGKGVDALWASLTNRGEGGFSRAGQ